jgi:selenocysteine lyase/cysteine desulfurase
LQQTLAEQNVAVSVRGSAIRVSPHVYNTAKDIGALLDGLGRANQ